jgi:hypothetical protein
MTKANGITLMTQANGMILMTHSKVFPFGSCAHVLSLTYWHIRREILMFYNGNVVCGILRSVAR